MGDRVPEPTLVLVIEDEYLLWRDVEDALTSGGFFRENFSSGEEAPRMFRNGTKNYKALVTDVNLGDGLNGWEVAQRIKEAAHQGKRSRFSRNLHHRLFRRRMDGARRPAPERR